MCESSYCQWTDASISYKVACSPSENSDRTVHIQSCRKCCAPAQMKLPLKGADHKAHPYPRHRHITKTCLFKYVENFSTKNWKFSDKIFSNFVIFLISAQNKYCGYTLEPPQRGGSTTTHNLCFWAEIRKIMYTPVNPSFTIWRDCVSILYPNVFYSTQVVK